MRFTHEHVRFIAETIRDSDLPDEAIEEFNNPQTSVWHIGTRMHMAQEFANKFNEMYTDFDREWFITLAISDPRNVE